MTKSFGNLLYMYIGGTQRTFAPEINLQNTIPRIASSAQDLNRSSPKTVLYSTYIYNAVQTVTYIHILGDRRMSG